MTTGEAMASAAGDRGEGSTREPPCGQNVGAAKGRHLEVFFFVVVVVVVLLLLLLLPRRCRLENERVLGAQAAAEHIKHLPRQDRGGAR